MMTAMRENMPLIMWILVGAFLATIVFSWGMGGFDGGSTLDGVVGKIGNREILYDQYNRIVQDRLARLRQEGENAPITEAQIKQVRKEVWDELVRNEIMDVYAEKWGLRTSDAEVAWAVKNSPPQWLRENEAFQKDGRFDLASYDQFLRDPRSADILVAIEADYRSSLAHQKVVDRVIAPVFVADDEAYDDFLATNRRFSVAVVSFLPRNFEVDTASITNEEIRTYYTNHRDEFRRAEQRKLSYVSFPIQATTEDSNRVIELAREVLGRAKSGEDFAELAADFSEDEGSAQRGGDLGYFTSGRMVTEFDSAAFNTQPGEIVGPVLTRFGAHVIQVLDRKSVATGDSVHARHILLKWNVGSDTEERIAQRAKDFTDAAKSDGWNAAAERFSLESKETDGFTKNPSSNIPGFGALAPVMDFAFSSKVGALSYVYRTRVQGQEAYAVFQLREILPETIQPLAEVESRIRRTLVQEKKVELAKQAAHQFRTRVGDEQSFLAVAAAENLKVDTSREKGPRDFIQGWGTDEEIAKKLFALNPGDVSPALENVRGGYVAVLISKTEPDAAFFAAQKNDIVKRLRQTKQNNVYADWLAQAKETVKIQDKRHLYYTDY